MEEDVESDDAMMGLGDRHALDVAIAWSYVDASLLGAVRERPARLVAMLWRPWHRP